MGARDRIRVADNTDNETENADLSNSDYGDPKCSIAEESGTIDGGGASYTDDLSLDGECATSELILGKRKSRRERQIVLASNENEIEEGQISEEMEDDMNSPNQELDSAKTSGHNDPLVCNQILHSDSTPVSKKARVECNQQSSVHITYTSLTRTSKRKLEELLKTWSEWHAQQYSVAQGRDEALESGQCTYFPALSAGPQSSVSFVADKLGNEQSQNAGSLCSISVPFYDREYAVGLTLGGGVRNAEGGIEIVGDPSRCFNCGSYNHSLKECDKPRDSAAVSNARKEYNLKKNQKANSQNANRYYQNSLGGKFDDLKPGVLHPETRKALNLGEFDPPPWLERMRELGYPPGYLDQDEDERPSGITIFGEEGGDGEEEGEIIATKEPKQKMSVEFPGVNAPIPENADTGKWAVDRKPPSIFQRLGHSSRSRTRGRIAGDRWHGSLVDDGPPGVDSPPPLYPPRYGESSTGRPHFDRAARWRIYEDFSGRGAFDSPPASPTSAPYYRSRGGEEDRRGYGFDYRNDRYHSRR